ncbi:MAG: site-specific DNA-methyltransferase [Anaerolineales bacterium]|nr:site-specific DNA-methyltransferase [Anaerolineales bacterium]
MTEPEKVDLRSLNPADEKISRLQAAISEIMPEALTEGRSIDLDKLKLALGEVVDAGKERYGMTWPGKTDCFKTIQTPSTGTLLPATDESVDFDGTENLIIEGDNLEVLKLLQKAYLGKVKMIYIDPPYNTGNDFIYPDNYTESLQTYLEYTGQVDAEGKKFGTNSDTDGRFHSRWLNMMYPRLYLARNLLREDGVVFISIDDNEVANLRKLCDDIFGEDNFIANIIWQKKFAPQNDAKYFSDNHDHILLFARDKNSWNRNLLPRSEKSNERYDNPDKDPRGPWASSDLLRMEHRDNSVYTITSPNGKKWKPESGTSWRHPEDEMLSLIEDNQVWFGADGNGKPRRKRFLKDVRQGVVPETIWPHSECGHNQEGTQIFKALFDGTGAEFTNPKPPRLIQKMLSISTQSDNNEIILDFFAGSGTVAQAVVELNRQDGGNRKYILVQLPEPIETKGYKNIADITVERVRRVINKFKDEEAGQLPMGKKQDRGFRVFKLAESNFKGWDASVSKDGKVLEQQLELHIDHIREGRTREDILYEILLKSGFPLTTSVEQIKLEGKSVYSVAGGGLLICLEKELTLEVIRAMADTKPQRVVCLDMGFAGNDQLKANAVQIFKTKDIVFRTV